MNRYAYVLVDYVKPFNKVMQIVDAEETPTYLPNGFWVEITGNTAVQVGWKATTVNYVDWFFSEPTYDEREKDIAYEVLTLLNAAGKWLLVNPLEYKNDIGVASPEEQALLLAYKHYCVDVSGVKTQSGYPYTVNWPVAPF
ncbi:tail fiber assembly protein [Pseudomonas hamedanensis]|uniref:Tail fiber assembly protein n=1 Tax=Pseudomonas hamedanensis TaxID=2745504 RepID=A0A9E6P466_9PSED|nr:tail fiber assembly protein [Pseudomonas hamedanensis]QXI19652.1 tail fiber assembly protein [Pseudomonas hamedanensis]